jgi:folate-dependent phosphoribosylglycinamide formyltransferase PurN
MHLYINTENDVNFHEFMHVCPLSKLISLYSHAFICSSKVHQAVIAAGSEKSGCTVHFVTEEVDGGPIVLQGQCSVIQGTDSPESLKAKVNDLNVCVH